MNSLNRIAATGGWHSPGGIPAFAMKDGGHAAAPGGFAHLFAPLLLCALCVSVVRIFGG